MDHGRFITKWVLHHCLLKRAARPKLHPPLMHAVAYPVPQRRRVLVRACRIRLGAKNNYSALRLYEIWKFTQVVEDLDTNKEIYIRDFLTVEFSFLKQR